MTAQEVSQWNFENVAPDPRDDTFAYWLGVLNDPVSETARHVRKICQALSYHFDVEDQADNAGQLSRYQDLMPVSFRPIAPVTLTKRWSPFPLAVAVMGDPDYSDCEKRRVVATFSPREELHLPGPGSPDQAHFGGLLQACNERALVNHRWILLAGAVGWSYDRDGTLGGCEELDASDGLRSLMAHFG
jgi:hypothetical protein